MKKKQREPWTGYWGIPVIAITFFLAHIALYVFTFMYLTGKLDF